MRARTLLATAATLLLFPLSGARAQLPALPLDGRQLTPYLREFRIVLARGGDVQQIGRATDRVEGTRVDGRDALLRIQTTELNGRLQVDSAVAMRGDMTPVSLAVHRQSRSVRLSFAGLRAWGTWREAGGSRPVERIGAGVLYNTSMMEFVIAALPLREGLSAEFDAIDSFRDGMPALRVAMTVSGTTGIEAGDGGRRRAWVVDATMAGQRARLFFDVETRHWLGAVLFAAPGSEIRYLPA